MDLTYKIENTIYQLYNHLSKDGLSIQGNLILKIDENNLAQFKKVYTENDALAQNEILLPFACEARVQIPLSSSFFFEEGAANFYEFAEYGVFSYDEGKYILVDLADEYKRIIKGPYGEENFEAFRQEIFDLRF